MKPIKIIQSLVYLIVLAAPIHPQALLNADGPGDTYELINGVLAPGYNVVEHPECIHPEFGRHIAEAWDDALGKYVFEFYIHVTPDNDRCINLDRQRMEIKTYDASPENLKGVTGESVTYKWRFKLPADFQPSGNFTHIHQVKAVGGTDDDPIFTLTVRKGSPNKVELIHDNTTKVAIVNQSFFAGEWVECTEIITVGVTGTYSLTIKKVSDGSTVMSYSSGSILTIRADNSFIRPKWGIYRSLLSSSDLRDDTIRFSGFYIGEETATAVPAAPATLNAGVASATRIDLSWSDNSTNEESFRIERSGNGSDWTILAETDPNSTTYSDTVTDSSVPYFYRVRSENTCGSSSFSAVAGTVAGHVFSAASGNWASASTWIGGTVPTSTDDVTVNSGHNVVVDDIEASCSDLVVNDTLTFTNTMTVTLTVNGNCTVASGGALMTVPQSTPGNALIHSLKIKGNITSSGTFDLRNGSGSNPSSTICAADVTFLGSGNSTVNVPPAADFNGVTIDKEGIGKVILSSNVVQNNNSSTAPSTLTLTGGIIETGEYVWNVLNTSNGSIIGGSASGHVNGTLARGWASTGTVNNKLFPLGDGMVYRPAYVSNTNSSYHLLAVQLIAGNANTGSSTLIGGISNISSLRYYKATVGVLPGRTGTPFTLTGSGIGYYADDGVSAGNTDLRIALSFDGRQTWTAYGPTGHTTSTVSDPTQLLSSALSQSVAQGTSFFIALANLTGGDNPLPVEISDFSATVRHSYAQLEWRTAVETNSVGFDVERMRVQEGAENRWESIGFVRSSGTSNGPQEYRYTDNSFGAGVVRYRLKIIDRDGSARYSSEVSAVIGTAPMMFFLSSNYPNPFNPVTAIEFAVPVTGATTLTVHNPLGQNIAVVYKGIAESGKVYYVTFDAKELTSGFYFYRLSSGGFTKTKKMLLVK